MPQENVQKLRAKLIEEELEEFRAANEDEDITEVADSPVRRLRRSRLLRAPRRARGLF